LNDVAIAVRRLQREGRIARALIVDLDVHQGNGTAAIFEGDDSVFTFSMHGERNYPSRKMRSSLDVGLPDGIDDDAYLSTLQEMLPRLKENFHPDIVFYLAGVDVAAGDRYGRFNLSDEGIRARDRKVLEWTAHHGLPLAITLAGGYSPNAVRTAMLHTLVFEEAMK
jgi:acetoin utilization deacetylase AcuC-like enzyme